MNEDTNTNTNEAAKSLEDLRALARDMNELALALTTGEKMKGFAMALRLVTFSDRIRQALGEMPRMGEKVADFQKRQATLFAAASAAIREATELAAGAKAASDIPAPGQIAGEAANTTDEAEPGWLEVRERGMKFSRFSTETRRHLLAKEPGNKCQPSKLHEIRVEPCEVAPGDFDARYAIDGKIKIALLAHSVSKAEKCALAAAKAYMRDSHHNARKNRRGEKRQAAEAKNGD